MKILFQGDSITDGNRYKEPERRHDLNHQIGHSYAFIVSGMLGAEYPDAGLKFVNRGISGDTTRGLLRRWREDALDIEPDVLSLLIGTNDCFLEGENHVEPEEYEKNLENILSQSFETNGELKVFLMEPDIRKSAAALPKRTAGYFLSSFSICSTKQQRDVTAPTGFGTASTRRRAGTR